MKKLSNFKLLFKYFKKDKLKLFLYVFLVLCTYMPALISAYFWGKALEDLDYFGDRKDEIKAKAKTASDVWIEYDKSRYKDDELFDKFIIDIQKLKKEDLL